MNIWHQGCYRSIKDSDECDQLQFLSFFGHTSSPEQWQEQWQEDIDLQLAETAHIKHTRKSVSDFMNNINSQQTSSNGRNKDLQFITMILSMPMRKTQRTGASMTGFPVLTICMMLIQSKPDYIQRCVNLKREYSVLNKRQKII